jgi:hypothetical protein
LKLVWLRDSVKNHKPFSNRFTNWKMLRFEQIMLALAGSSFL